MNPKVVIRSETDADVGAITEATIAACAPPCEHKRQVTTG